MHIETFERKWTEYLKHTEFKSVESPEDREEYKQLVSEAQTVDVSDMVAYVKQELTRKPANRLTLFFVDWCNLVCGPDTIKVDGYVDICELSSKILEIIP